MSLIINQISEDLLYDEDGNVDVDLLIKLIKSNHFNISKVPDAKYMVLEARVTDGQEPTTDESLKILRAADILFDTSRGSGVPVKGPNSESLNYLLENLGLDQLAFGTETPFVDYCSPFLRLGAFNTIDEKTKQMIWSGNARRMLNL